MWNPSTSCNPHRHIRHRYCTIMWVHRFIPDLIMHIINNHGTDRWCARWHSNTPKLRNWHHSLHGPVVCAYLHHRKDLPRSNLSWNICQDFPKIPSLWNCSADRAKIRLKSHLESKVTPKVSISSDSFSTVPPINADDWGCIVRDRETIIISVLLSFSFIPQRSYHSLTLTRSLLCNCNSKAWGRHNSYQCGVIDITDQLILQNGKKLRSVQELPKHCPAVLLTTLTSLFRQASAITCSDLFDGNCDNIDST